MEVVVRDAIYYYNRFLSAELLALDLPSDSSAVCVDKDTPASVSLRLLILVNDVDIFCLVSAGSFFPVIAVDILRLVSFLPFGYLAVDSFLSLGITHSFTHARTHSHLIRIQSHLIVSVPWHADSFL